MWSFLLAATLTASPADAWPAFRGTGDSISLAHELPLVWNEETGIAWKVPVAGYGQSGPVVWKNRIFVTSNEGPNKEQSLSSCFELSTGKKLWQEQVKSSQTVAVSDYVSRSAPTPAVDADRVYAFFDTGELVARSHEGELVWHRTLTEEFGKFEGNHGVGSSIAISDQALFVLVDHDGPSYLLAVEKATGKTLWKVDRPKKVSWSSPILAGDWLIVSSNGRCEAIDPKSGKTQWTFDGLKGNTVPSATVTENAVIVGSSEVNSNVSIRTGGEGDVTASHLQWRSEDASATFSSPLAYQGHLYFVNRSGVAFCLDQKSGKAVWNQRVGGACWASPIGACGRVYFFEKSGKTTVVAAGAELKVLASNEVATDDRIYGVAAVEGRFIFRTGGQLICISKKSSAATPSQDKAE